MFLTLDDATGPVDATFFEDAQGPYAATVFHSWLLVVRGVLRRTGRRGVSLRATGCWELPVLHDAWQRRRLDAVRELMAAVPEGFGAGAAEERRAGRGREPVDPPGDRPAADRQRSDREPAEATPPGTARRRRHGPPPGAGALERVPSRPTPTSSRPARTPRPPPGESGVDGSPQAVALLPGELRWLARAAGRAPDAVRH